LVVQTLFMVNHLTQIENLLFYTKNIGPVLLYQRYVILYKAFVSHCTYRDLFSIQYDLKDSKDIVSEMYFNR
jgi:hypothetical protein